MGLLRRKEDKYKEAARLLSDGEVQGAIEKLRELLEEEPEHINAHTSLAVALMEIQKEPAWDSQKTQEAMAHYDVAAELDPEDPVPIFNKGVTLRDLGRMEEALECFDEALEREERFTLAILHKAEINYELERWEDAIDLARLALIRDPGIEGALGWVPDAMRKAGLLEDEEPETE
ncbi:MAG: tetratricopeptide repeat protein [Candidatus Thorarchaeota archaeon]|jgi:tetratricopeptide (TPR) repeat protein